MIRQSGRPVKTASASPFTSASARRPPSFQQDADNELDDDDNDDDDHSDESEDEYEKVDVEAHRYAEAIMGWFMDGDMSDRVPRGNSVNKARFFLVLEDLAMEKPEVVGYLLKKVTKDNPDLAIDLTQDVVAGTPEVLDYY